MQRIMRSTVQFASFSKFVEIFNAACALSNFQLMLEWKIYNVVDSCYVD